MLDGAAQGLELRVLHRGRGADLRGERLAEGRQAAGQLFARLALCASRAQEEHAEQPSDRNRHQEGQCQKDFDHEGSILDMLPVWKPLPVYARHAGTARLSCSTTPPSLGT